MPQKTEVNRERKRRPKGSGSLFLRGSIWWASISRKGKTYSFSTGTTDKRKAASVLCRNPWAVLKGMEALEQINSPAPTESEFWGGLKRFVCAHRHQVGRWTAIKSWREAPIGPGCYALIVGGKAAYIGQSWQLRERLRSHGWKTGRDGVETKWGTFPGATIKVRPVYRCGEQLMIEARLLVRLRPALNKFNPFR